MNEPYKFQYDQPYIKKSPKSYEFVCAVCKKPLRSHRNLKICLNCLLRCPTCHAQLKGKLGKWHCDDHGSWTFAELEKVYDKRD